ncbi:DHA2 family efflux MFS transporter permease subunit [Streptomyces sp. SID3343]|uniref:DHA2 family efflux MFS transporter permease subunit n=1 Tax=Streptomyces sp. SID3343 TaxID=2690260 RepID=UPI00136B3E56|nr:DHA2 family efflux MFS transporter permease subunit [Streptomyces sp. SID3343]MYV97854.1 DHA2 family efflux MFS transporter permease subunit [Streptomyces sp. SID3343]
MPAAFGSNRNWWALAALSLAMVAVGLDGTVLSVALPELAGSLDATESDLQWFSSSYLLFLAAAMLPAGLLGDRYGRRRVLVGALSLFALSSAACAYATSPAQFIAARSVLGLGGAGIIVMALSALTVLFSEEERPRAVGIWSAANFLALPIGPLLGGWVLTHHWWGWVFLINVPIAVLGTVVVLALVPESRSAQRPRLDPIGVALSTVGLVGVTYGLIEAGRYGWTDPRAWAVIVGGLAVLVAFCRFEYVIAERRGGRPLLDLSLFRSASYSWGVILVGVVVFANIGVLFTMPQYFQAVRDTDAMGSGVRLLPLIGGLVIGALPADRVARRIGAKYAVAVGFAVLAAGMFLGAATSVDSDTAFVAVWMGLTGAGMGLAMATAASAALSEVSPERSGAGAAVLQAVNKVGGPFGSAVLGSVLLTSYRAHVAVPAPVPDSAGDAVRSGVFDGMAVAAEYASPALRTSVRESFVHGMDVALVVSGGIALAGLALALAFLPATRKRTEAIAQDTEERYDDAPAA